jgi:hypothetical protein
MQRKCVYHCKVIIIRRVNKTRLLLIDKTCQTSWSFEQFSNTDIQTHLETFLLSSTSPKTRDECLTLCLNNKNLTSNCHAAVYDTKNGLCKLFSISPNRVRDVKQYFDTYKEDTISLFERACLDDDDNGVFGFVFDLFIFFRFDITQMRLSSTVWCYTTKCL